MSHSQDLRSQPSVSKRAKIGQTTVGRLLRKEQGATVEMIDALAAAFGVEPWQLLVPDIEPTNPPVLQPVTERERRLYEQFRQLIRGAANNTESP